MSEKEKYPDGDYLIRHPVEEYLCIAELTTWNDNTRTFCESGGVEEFDFDQVSIKVSVEDALISDLMREAMEMLTAALGVLLDSVDYTAGACGLTEMVGAALPKEVIEMAKLALQTNQNIFKIIEEK